VIKQRRYKWAATCRVRT